MQCDTGYPAGLHLARRQPDLSAEDHEHWHGQPNDDARNVREKSGDLRVVGESRVVCLERDERVQHTPRGVPQEEPRDRHGGEPRHVCDEREHALRNVADPEARRLDLDLHLGAELQGLGAVLPG